MTKAHPAGEFVGEVSPETRLVRVITHEDTTYELYVGPCDECRRHPVYRLMRVCGASLSVYEISAKDSENLDEYVAKLHMTFAVDVITKLTELRLTIRELNSKGAFEAG